MIIEHPDKTACDVVRFSQKDMVLDLMYLGFTPIRVLAAYNGSGDQPYLYWEFDRAEVNETVMKISSNETDDLVCKLQDIATAMKAWYAAVEVSRSKLDGR